MDEANAYDFGALSPLWNFVLQMAEMHRDSAEEALTELVSLTLDTPIEMEILVDDDGDVVIASAPPTQQIVTTFMPVIHTLRVMVTPDDAASNS